MLRLLGDRLLFSGGPCCICDPSTRKSFRLRFDDQYHCKVECRLMSRDCDV